MVSPPGLSSPFDAAQEVLATTQDETFNVNVMDDSLDAASFRLVWCHERCHKAEKLAVRQGLTEALMSKSGGMGGLVCFKKANRFAMWILRAQRQSYTLVTNWREAQPCANAILQNGGRNKPAAIIIVCDSIRQAHRARVWAKRQPQEQLGQVLVFDSAKIPQDLLGGMLHQFFTEDHDEAGELAEGKDDVECNDDSQNCHNTSFEDDRTHGSDRSTAADEENIDAGSAYGADTIASTSSVGGEDTRQPYYYADSVNDSQWESMQPQYFEPQMPAFEPQMPAFDPHMPAFIDVPSTNYIDVPSQNYMQAFGPYSNSLHIVPPGLQQPKRAMNIDDFVRYLQGCPQGFKPPVGMTVSL